MTVIPHQRIEQTRPIRVAVIDDHPVVLEGIRAWVAADEQHRVEIVAAGDDIDAVLAGPGGTSDVLLLDLQLHEHNAIDRVDELATAGHRVIVFSQHTDEATILAALEAGACAYVAKHEALEHCVETIVSVANDRPYVTPSVAGAFVADERPGSPKLSAKEQEALRLWFQGMSKASVARRMNITEHTVKQYIDRARLKYVKAGRRAPTTFALLARAIEDGLIDPAEIGEYRSFAASPFGG